MRPKAYGEVNQQMQPVFVTSDGKPFHNKEEAKHYQRRINLLKWADDVHLCCGGEWDAEMVIGEILDHFEEFADI